MDALALKPDRLSPADERVIGWLDRFERAPADRDAATCLRRDIVAFT